MTVVDRAADVIRKALAGPEADPLTDCYTAEDIARALADAGLLVDDRKFIDRIDRDVAAEVDRRLGMALINDPSPTAFSDSIRRAVEATVEGEDRAGTSVAEDGTHNAPVAGSIPAPPTGRRTLADIIAHADELADAFEAYEPRPEDERPPTPEMLARLAEWRIKHDS